MYKWTVHFAALARDAGLQPQLHFVDVPADERWRRVEARNAAGTGDLNFAISRAMFDYVASMWEAPEAAEMAAVRLSAVPTAAAD